MGENQPRHDQRGGIVAGLERVDNESGQREKSNRGDECDSIPNGLETPARQSPLSTQSGVYVATSRASRPMLARKRFAASAAPT